MRNLNYDITHVVPFDALPWDANISFSLKKGNEVVSVGLNQYAAAHRQVREISSEMTIRFTDLKEDQRQILKTIHDDLGSAIPLPVDDISDNFVFPWSYRGVLQYGLLHRIVGTTNQYRGCKIYQAGTQIGIRKIYYYPPDVVTSVDGLTTGYTLDTDTGIFTSTSDLQGVPFTADIYYPLYRLPDRLNWNTYYANKGVISLINTTSDRGTTFTNNFYTELQLTEHISAEPIELSVFTAAGSDLTELDLDKYQRDLQGGQEFPVAKVENKGTVFTTLKGNTPVTYLKIPQNTFKHKDLIYFQTIFRATGGGAFYVNE